jgi:alpha-beta hydrolase superfamily lysophospholipase
VRDLGDVQDHLAYRQPEAPKVLVGHGLGALWALAYASERAGELAGLVLAAPLLAPRFEPPQKKGGLLGRFKKPLPEDAGRLAWEPEALGADELVHDRITLRAAEEAEAAARAFEQRLAALDAPALVLGGAEDTLAPTERLRALASERCEVRVLDGRGHGLLHGPSADEARALVAAWVAERA